MNHLEALLTPAEFSALRERDLSETVCIVFDVLRATSTMLQALANGAAAILPVPDIATALAIKAREPEVLLAGERDGLRITAALTGGIEFDLGNSPREFTAERVTGRRIVMTTTNGTRALEACAGAQAVLAASLGNLAATARWLERHDPARVALVCAGTFEHAAYEDALGAGALADIIWSFVSHGWVDDAARMVRELYRTQQHQLMRAVSEGRNGQRLLGRPELADDVAVCVAVDRFDFIARTHLDGTVQRQRIL